jgi:hypothetical protein
MKCGHCRGSHDTIAEVKACHQEAVRSAPPASVRSGSTERQADFIRALLEQTGKTEQDLAKPINQMDVEEASKSIEWLKEFKASMPRREPVQLALAATIESGQVPQGTYTVVFSDNIGDDRITMRFRAPRYGKWQGTQLAEYLYGPNNDRDFRRCANWAGNGYRVWASYLNNKKINDAIRYLADGDAEQRQEAGMTYALASSNCWRCGRTLTVPASIHRGLGPECAQIVGGV